MRVIKIIILLFCIFILFPACEKVFKDDLENRLEIKNAEDLENAVAGLNNRFCIPLNNMNFYYINSDETANVNSTNMDMDGKICIQNYIENNYTGVTDELWESTYRTIINANSILEKAEALNKENAQIKRILGEIYFLRAFSYFQLVRFFGQVPIITNDEVSYNVSKSDFEDIYGFILDDLKKAEESLPESNFKARIRFVTPHRGTVKALLAEVYLSMAGYPLKRQEFYEFAARSAKEVIDSADFYGFELLPDFKDLWNGKQRLNSESVFSIYFNDNNLNDIWGYPSPYILVSYSIGRINIKFYNRSPRNYRKIQTYRTSKSVYTIYENYLPYNTPDTIPDYMDMCSEMLYRKIFNPFRSSVLNQNEGRTIYLIRYAKTLLTYAEAKARMGDMDNSVYEAVNLIRRRANHVALYSSSPFDLKPGLTPAQFADSVVQERAYEFCAEPEGRQMDMLRLEMFDQLPKLRFPNQGNPKAVGINPVTKFFPIPQKDIKLNPNLE